MRDLPTIALVAEDASLRMGPDAARALHYFRAMRARGLDVHLVTRACHLPELERVLEGEAERLHGVADPTSALLLARLGLLLPEAGRRAANRLRSLASQRAQRRRVSQLVRRKGVRIVHQITPVHPRMPSRMEGLGVPVVMGPLRLPPQAPPGFRAPATRVERALAAARWLLRPLPHWFLRGRRRASALLVTDAPSSRAVPAGARGRKLRIPADGIELESWKPAKETHDAEVPELLFAGRLSRGSGVDLLLDAFRLSLDAGPARLRIAGDGPLSASVVRRIEELDLGAHVELEGWLDPDALRRALARADAFVYPNLAGEADETLMQAMAMGLPVIGTDWGAPSDLAGEGAGLLVGPRSPEQFTHELASVIHQVAASPDLRRELGGRARSQARSDFDWNHRLDRVLDAYRLVDDASLRRD